MPAHIIKCSKIQSIPIIFPGFKIFLSFGNLKFNAYFHFQNVIWSDVFYTMKGGDVTGMALNQKNLSLVVNIDTNSDGVLDIKLLRDNIDALSGNGLDIDYIVLVYEKDNSVVPIQTEYKKIDKNDDYRALSIPIKNNDVKVEIVGTHVVPEFGTIAMIVLAVAIVSIIAVSAKSRLSIMPRI